MAGSRQYKVDAEPVATVAPIARIVALAMLQVQNWIWIFCIIMTKQHPVLVRCKGGATHLGDYLQVAQLALVLRGVKVGDAPLEARLLVQLTPQHHLVVGAGVFLLRVEAAQ